MGAVTVFCANVVVNALLERHGRASLRTMSKLPAACLHLARHSTFNGVRRVLSSDQRRQPAQTCWSGYPASRMNSLPQGLQLPQVFVSVPHDLFLPIHGVTHAKGAALGIGEG